MSDSYSLTPEQKNLAESTYKYFTTVNDGHSVVVSQLEEMFQYMRCSVSPNQLHEWTEQLGISGNEHVNLEQFKRLYARKLRYDDDLRDLRDAFRALDKKRRGSIDVEDLKWILKNLDTTLTDEDIESMVQNVDTDDSGSVDFQEFYKLITSD
ncbi:hypothetical protein AAHC03_016863 [Spirometra sp. Aus1]